MKNVWVSIIKPKGFVAKWLLLIFISGLVYLWTEGHFDIAKEYLDTDKMSFKAGNFEITAYGAIKALFSVIIIFWITSIVSDFSDKRVSGMKKLRAANKALVQKILQILIYAAAFLITLNILGINLTSLTVLGGAVGIGLGFGLQKITSNFISGIILILERSIKPGDLLELSDGTTGYVRRSTSRATMIETFDGKEVIVPNEDFIVKQVINWTLSNNKARVTINFGVSYSSDIDKARDLALEAVREHPRFLKIPDPSCFLDAFGDSSVDFVMYFWVNDVTEGLRNIKSEVMFSIWHKFKANDIEIPFPQRDLHLRTSEPIKVINSNGKE